MFRAPIYQGSLCQSIRSGTSSPLRDLVTQTWRGLPQVRPAADRRRVRVDRDDDRADQGSGRSHPRRTGAALQRTAPRHRCRVRAAGARPEHRQRRGRRRGAAGPVRVISHGRFIRRRSRGRDNPAHPQAPAPYFDLDREPVFRSVLLEHRNLSRDLRRSLPIRRYRGNPV